MFDFANMDDEGFARLIASMRIAGTDRVSCEVKTARGGLPRDIGSTISAFANGAGGLIVCGLSERDGFIPVEGFDAARIQDMLATWCGERMTPPVRAIIDARQFEGKAVVTAYIPEMRPKDKPCYVSASGRYMGSYIRMADGDCRLSPYEVDRFMDEHEQPRYDARVVGDASLADLDPQLVTGVLARERAVHPRNFAHLDDETALTKLRVLAKDETGVLRPTLAGLVVLGAYPQEFFPRLCVVFARYPGNSKAQPTSDGRRFLDMATCVGSIPAMVQDVLVAVGRNMRTGARIEGAFRTDVPDYPLVAVREAVVNALMHRDYSDEALGTPVAVDMYDDRLEVRNAGGLYGCVTIRSLEDAPIASARNQFLSALLENTPLEGGGFVAENRGTGYQSICLALQEAGMPAPEPHDSPSAFTLVMRRRKEGGLYAGALRLTDVPSGSARGGVREDAVACAKSFVKQDEVIMRLDDFIVEVITMRGTASMAELMEESGRSRPTVLKAVQGLVAQGVIRPTQKKNSPRQRYGLASGL